MNVQITLTYGEGSLLDIGKVGDNEEKKEKDMDK